MDDKFKPKLQGCSYSAYSETRGPDGHRIQFIFDSDTVAYADKNQAYQRCLCRCTDLNKQYKFI